MRLQRRQFIRLGLAVGGALAGGARALALPEPAPAATRCLQLRNLHTGEELTVASAADGCFASPTMDVVATLLRDFRTGERHDIDPKLLDVLCDTAAALGADPTFAVISGYRSPQTNEMLRSRSGGVSLRSLHMEGRAIDVRLAGVGCERLAERALQLGRGGVGFYRRSDFVHLDTGRARSWRG